MGTVALCAQSVLNGLMSYLGRLERSPHAGMALKTERTLDLYDHPFIIAGMGSMAIQARALRKRRMNSIVLDFFHEITVALFAEFGSDRLEQFSLIRTVGIVARGALAVENGLMNDFLRKVRFRVGMTRVAYRIHSVFKQAGEIRTMGVMACRAQGLGEGRMPVLGGCLRLPGLRMTRETEITAFCHEQMLVLGSMRPVTGKASSLTCNGRVGVGNLLLLIRMAVEAEVVPALFQKFRVLRRVRIMTLDAHPLFERHMLDRAACPEIVTHMALFTETPDVVLFQRKRFIRTWGVMAHVAAGRHDRIVRARFQEFWLV